MCLMIFKMIDNLKDKLGKLIRIEIVAELLL